MIGNADCMQTVSAGPNTPPDQIVTLDVVVSPDTAKLYLDEAKLDLPYHAIVNRDGVSYLFYTGSSRTAEGPRRLAVRRRHCGTVP